MAAPITQGVLYVHSAPRALCQHVEWGLGRALGEPASLPWIAQPVIPGSVRAEYTWHGPAGTGAAIASQLRGWEHLRFEVSEDPSPNVDGGRWLHTPGLGIFYAQTDMSGNVVIPEERIRYAMEVSGGDATELHRELALALGKAWDEELEPFRTAGDESPVVWMHRVG